MNLLLAGRWDDAERDPWAHELRRAMPQHRLLLRADEADATTIEVAIVANPAPGSLRHLPALRLIQSLWAGVDRLLADPDLPAGVPIARMVDPAMNAAMAETVLWAVLGLQRGFFRYARQQSEGRWQVHPQRRADEVPVLVLGFGQMGRTAAGRLAEQGFPVTAWSRSAAAPVPGVATLHGDMALRRALPRASIVVNLLPLTTRTRGLLDAGFIAALPRGAAIVNLGRGPHLVDDDLLAALDRGVLGHAVLDVFDTEPLPSAHRYWRHDRVTLLPHVAAQTDARSAAQVVAANIEALRTGRPPAHRVDGGRGY